MKNYQFYHMYPLGMLDKLQGHNDRKIQELTKFLPHLKSMSVNSVLIGPIFESEYHGYDTINYSKVDPRLGDNEGFKTFVDTCHKEGVDVIVDCVFNHVSRKFWAFEDVISKKQSSEFCSWFGIDFSKESYRNEGFTYNTWDGHDELVKLDLGNDAVRDYLIQVALKWQEEFSIDGLRMDAADVMDRRFLKDLTDALRKNNPDFYIVGEMVHGDYNQLIQETGFNAVTNFECYKGLYSSLNDVNYFEIGHSLKRLLSQGGAIKQGSMYNFVDNHDVNRVASMLNKEEHLYPLYLMMYTMKGSTSIYYKSEFMEKGKRNDHSDYELRKPFFPEDISNEGPLLNAIQKLGKIRSENQVLAFGDYEELVLDHTLIGFKREYKGENAIVLINSGAEESIDDNVVKFWIMMNGLKGYDVLNDENISDGDLKVYSNWGRIII